MPTPYEVAEMVLAELQGAFVTSAHPPAAWQLVVGQEMAADLDAFSDGAGCGLGFVMVPAARLEPGAQQSPGGALFTRQSLVLGVLRCAPTIGDDLRSPTAAEQAAFAKVVLDDQVRLLAAVLAASEFDWVTEGDVSETPWEAIPVEGGVGGGAVTVELAIIGDCP